MRPICLLALCLVCALTAGCGDADRQVPSHGLEAKGLESAPTGEAVTLAYDLEHLAAYTAELSVTTEVFQKGMVEGRNKDQKLKLHATMQHTWVIKRQRPEVPMTSTIELRYVDAEGQSAEKLLARAPMQGRLAHDSKGKPLPASLRLTGGSKAEQIEVLDLVGSLLLAGYGGAPSWMPPHPVREGEAWPLQPFLNLRAVANMQNRARELGVSAPRPTFQGTARLRRIVRGEDGVKLELELDALIEFEGQLRSADGRTGAISSGDRFQGLATIDAQTGVPVSMDVSHVHRQRVRSGGDDITIGGTTTVRGTVTRADRDR